MDSSERSHVNSLRSDASNKTSSTVSKYIRNFENLFMPVDRKKLCERARSGSLEHCQFRSICWRYFLHCLPEQPDQWLDSCEKSRRNYIQIKLRHSASIKKKLDLESVQTVKTSWSDVVPRGKCSVSEKDRTEDKSLSPGEVIEDRVHIENIHETDSRHHEEPEECDHKNLFRTIERDVIRTYPDMEFFRQTEMQSILENVLFNFASENSHLSYKQGMHELLATLLYVLHTDSQNCLINYEGGYANETIATLLDLKYLEHDAYQLFSALMGSVETWYQNDEILTPSTIESGSISDSKDTSINRSNYRQVSSVLSIKLKMISENIVRKFDTELFNHLEALQIAPQIYGIRWMRLIFSREFEFLDLLSIWDAIICDDEPVSMSLTEYIFGALLISLRETLVNEDFTGCLTSLMRTQFKDTQFVIRLALHFRDPIRFSKPNHPSMRSSLSPKAQSGSQHNNSIFPPEVTSLANRLSQQYINAKRQINDKTNSFRSLASGNQNSATKWQSSGKPAIVGVQDGTQRSRSSHDYSQVDFGQIHDKNYGSKDQNSLYSFGAQSTRPTSGSSANKFLPTLNKFVSSIGQSNNYNSSVRGLGPQQIIQPEAGSSQKTKNRMARNQSNLANRNDALQSAVQSKRDYEMSEMQSMASDSSQTRRFPTTNLSGLSDLLSEQIDTFQRCLPKEKSLHSEDEILFALAQIKMVRDILKGSLRLEDELESASGGRDFGN